MAELKHKLYVSDNGSVFISNTWNPETGELHWMEISTGLEGTIQECWSDPFAYGRAYARTGDGLFVVDDIWGKSPEWKRIG